MKKLILSTALLAAICTAGQAQEKNDYYVKHVEFPQGATLEQEVDMAARLVPTPQQLEWQQMELTAFLHFGINTFTGREWGDGKENPALFNPTDFDAEQWVRSLKEAGFKMAILTAKHHDGFCLWPPRQPGTPWRPLPGKTGKGMWYASCAMLVINTASSLVFIFLLGIGTPLAMETLQNTMNSLSNN